MRGERSAYRPIVSGLAPGSDPLVITQALLARCARAGAAPLLYIADLDAIQGRAGHAAVLARLLEAVPALTLWLDGGFADVEVMTINAQHAESVRIVEELIAGLEQAGLSVLYDDRDERPGVKFKDADLVGVPIRVSVGEKSLAKGGIELKLRRESGPRIVPLADGLQAVLDVVQQLRNEVAAE